MKAPPRSRSSLPGARAVGERQQRDDAERRRRRGVEDEQEDERFLGDEPSEREADREREVEEQPVERVRGDAVLWWNQVGDQRTRGGAVELREERIHDDDRQDARERARLEQEEDQYRGRDHRERDRVASPDAIGEQAAGSCASTPPIP